MSRTKYWLDPTYGGSDHFTDRKGLIGAFLSGWRLGERRVDMPNHTKENCGHAHHWGENCDELHRAIGELARDLTREEQP